MNVKKGYFGEYGGCFAPETLMAPLAELEEAYLKAQKDAEFKRTLATYLKDYVGRPTPIYYASQLSKHLGGEQAFILNEKI